MSKFTDFNSIQPLVWPNTWITTKELVFYERDDLKGKKYVVPAWFITDWCSIGCPFWQSAKPRLIMACILHDYLWSKKIWFFKSNCLFFKALRANKASMFQSIKYYLWVSSPIGMYIYANK